MTRMDHRRTLFESQYLAKSLHLVVSESEIMMITETGLLAVLSYDLPMRNNMNSRRFLA